MKQSVRQDPVSQLNIPQIFHAMIDDLIRNPVLRNGTDREPPWNVVPLNFASSLIVVDLRVDLSAIQNDSAVRPRSGAALFFIIIHL